MTISIKEILAYMETGQVFSCKVVSYDRTRKTGGKIHEYPEAMLVQSDKSGQQATDNRQPTTQELLTAKLETLKKNPNHRHYYTRNIRDVQDGQPTSIIHKIHPPLIIEFNGKTATP